MSDLDPFSQVYNALWSLADGSAQLTSLVRPGNMIRLNDTTRPRSPLKDEVSNADLPEIVLVSNAVNGNLLNTSSSSMIIRQFQWIIATGDMSVVRRLLPIEFALFSAMCNWPTVLGSLRWNDQPFVKRCGLVSVDNGLTDSERNRGIRGWSAIWTVEVEMHFRTLDLLSYTSGTGTGP